MSSNFPTVSFASQLDPQERRELDALIAQLSVPAPIDVPFSLSNFEGKSGMTLTIAEHNVHTFYFIRKSPTRLFVSVNVQQFTIGGVMNPSIWVRIPDGRVAARGEGIGGVGSNAGGGIVLRVETLAATEWIRVATSPFTNWTASASTTIIFQIEFDVLPLAR